MIQQLEELVTVTKNAFGSEMKVVVIGLQTIEGRLLNEEIRNMILEMNGVFIDIGYISGYKRDRVEWQKMNGMRLSIAMKDGNMSGLGEVKRVTVNKDKNLEQVFRSRLVWRRTLRVIAKLLAVAGAVANQYMKEIKDTRGRNQLLKLEP